MTPAAIPLDPKNLSLLWASPERADEIAALHARLFDLPWDAESITRSIEHPASASFIALIREPRALAGFVIGRIAADEAEILSIGVSTDRQRHGIAVRLVEALVRAARKAEVRKLHLEVAQGNAPALALYAKLGFKESGRRKGYYEQPGSPAEDAVALTLVLS